MSELYNRLISDVEIYKSVYSIHSWMNEERLLSNYRAKDQRISDAQMFAQLKDFYNMKQVNHIIERVQNQIKNVVLGDKFLECEVFFRPKKMNDDEVVYRPLHTSDLVTQITIMTMMRVLLISKNKECKVFTELGKVIPDNFYGQLVSKKEEEFYSPWQKNYKLYSKNTSEKYEKYTATGEYKSELTLDLVNFFPSINPAVIYNKISTILGTRYKDEDLVILKKLVFKLLYLRIKNFRYLKHNNFLKYYNYIDENREFSDNVNFYTAGLTQGLPHSYFFGNLVMMDVQNIYKQKLGKIDDYYYVDDSVIFSQISSQTDFSNRIINVNNELKKLSSSYENLYNIMIKEISGFDNFLSKKILPDFDLNQRNLEFKIRIHQSGKSYYEEIQLGTKKGLFNIGYINRQASLGIIDVYTTKSESEDISIQKKFQIIKESIEKELIRISHLEEYEIYTKKLKRLHKFFEFREIIVGNRSDTDTQAKLLDDITSMIDLLKKGEISNFIDISEEFILLYKLNMLLDSNYTFEKEIFEDIKDTLDLLYSDYQGKKLSKQWSYSYYSRILKYNDYVKRYTKYFSIENFLDNHLRDFSRTHSKVKIDYYKKVRANLVKFGFEGIYLEFPENDKILIRIKELTNGNFFSHELQRVFMNAFFSKIMHVECSDSLVIYRHDGRHININELKILVNLRQNDFKIDKFIAYLSKLDLNDDNHAFPSINDIMPYFKTFIRDSEKICNLIDIHYLTEDIWRNGTKFLYFYTLHDQSHAIQLIKNSVTIIKKIDFLQISAYDFYVLFASCYMHDVSMVFHPDLMDFVTDNGKKQDEMIMEYKEMILKVIQKLDKGKITQKPNTEKGILSYFLDVFKEIDEYFENKIRIKHHKLSADFIKTSPELDFLDKAYRALVADVSESHGAHIAEVYGKKSTAKKDKLSVKFLKILIRLADLLDLSKERMSYHFLMRNFEFMSDESKFHHISHMITDGFEIKSEFNNKKLLGLDYKSYIENSVIQEVIVFKIKSNFSSFSPYEKIDKCIVCSSIESNGNTDYITLEFNGKQCTSQCVLMCRWLNDKFYYLVNELNALVEYLKNSSNYFDTQFRIVLEMNDDGQLNKPCQDLLVERYN